MTGGALERVFFSVCALCSAHRRPGMLNSLSQVVLKMASPGVPDFYQGSELWDFSLVDPDNRREVDYVLRQRIFNRLEPWVNHALSFVEPGSAGASKNWHWPDRTPPEREGHPDNTRPPLLMCVNCSSNGMMGRRRCLSPPADCVCANAIPLYSWKATTFRWKRRAERADHVVAFYTPISRADHFIPGGSSPGLNAWCRPHESLPVGKDSLAAHGYQNSAGVKRFSIPQSLHANRSVPRRSFSGILIGFRCPGCLSGWAFGGILLT